MSGIVALAGRGSERIERDTLETMNELLSHRGPDGTDIWCDDHVGLGHQALNTTPESEHDHQPRVDDGLVLTADVRLDNRQELLQSLSLLAEGQPITDSQLILQAYKEWGKSCPEHLIGSFSFIIWDTDRKSIFCARDRFGVKPFYYHVDSDCFAAASEMKGLLALPSVSSSVDEVRVGDFLVAQFDDKERSYYEDISRLPPAHTMTIDSNGVDIQQYWELDPSRVVTLESDAAYEREFRARFEDAVRGRLRSNQPVGTALSGGLDSSSITVMARELLPPEEPLHTYSNVFDDAPSSDEREFIETVTDREGITSHYTFLDGLGALIDDGEGQGHFDLPPHDPMHFGLWERYKHADEVGVGVLLEGALGDSAVGYGLGLLAQLLRTGRWRHLNRELQMMGEIVGAPPRHLLFRHAVRPLVPSTIVHLTRRYRGNPLWEQSENMTLDDAFVERIRLRQRYKERNSRSGIPLLTETARKRQCRSLQSGMITTSFEVADLTAAAFGVEPRYPFTDKRLVEFSLAIPPTQQLSDGWTRSIMRRSIDDLLPEKIQWRPWKTSLSEGFWNALAQEEEQIERMIAHPGEVARYVDIDKLERSFESFKQDWTSREARELWRALSLHTWLEQTDVVDNRTDTIHV